MAEQRRRCESEWRCGDSVRTRVGCAIGMLCVLVNTLLYLVLRL